MPTRRNFNVNCLHSFPCFRTTSQDSSDFDPRMLLIDERFFKRGMSTILMPESFIVKFTSEPLRRAIRIPRWMVLRNVSKLRYVGV